MKFRKGQFLILRIINTKPTLQGRIANNKWEFAECTLTVQSKEERREKQIEKISRRTMEALCRHTWPGNIRELQNLM